MVSVRLANRIAFVEMFSGKVFDDENFTEKLNF